MSFGIVAYAFGAVVLICFAGVFFFNKQQAVNPKAQTYALILTLVGIICLCGFVYSSNILSAIGIGKTANERTANAYNQYYASQGYMIGKKIAEVKPDAKVLLLVNDSDKAFIDANDDQRRIVCFVKALKEGFGGEITVDAPELSSLAKQSEEMRKMALASASYSTLVNGKDYNTVLNKYPSENVIVFASDLPMNPNELGQIKRIKKNNKDMIFLCNAVISNKDIINGWLQGKYISGLVQRKKGFQQGESAPNDYAEAFNEAYTLREE